MRKLRNCPTCSKEIAKSAKVCPHCGGKIKSGVVFRLFKMFTVVTVVSLIAIGFLSSQDKEKKKLEGLADIAPTLQFPSKRLDDLFYLGVNKLTSMQREEEISKLKSGVIQGKIGVGNVTKVSEKVYKIDAFDMEQMFYTTVVFHVQSLEDTKRIKSLKKLDKVSFKGKIKSVNLYRGNMGEGKLVIDPAIML